MPPILLKRLYLEPLSMVGLTRNSSIKTHLLHDVKYSDGLESELRFQYYKSLTLPNATRFSITSCMLAIVAGTIVNSPYLSLTRSAARARDLVSRRVPSNKPGCSGAVGFSLYTVTPMLVTLAGMKAWLSSRCRSIDV